MANTFVAKTEFIELKLKTRYTALNKPNQYGDWVVMGSPDQEALNIIRDLQTEGVKNQLKKDDDGYYIAFKRPSVKEVKNREGAVIKTIYFDPPPVVLADGTPLDMTQTILGSGSDVTVQLEVYQHATPTGGKAKAARLHKVRVDHLVEFKFPEDNNPKPVRKPSF